MDALDDLLVRRYSEMVSEEPKPLHVKSSVEREATADASTDSEDEDKPLDDENLTTEDQMESAENTSVDCVTDATESAETADSKVTHPDESNVQELKPAWEVDRFLWPAICDEVEDHLEAELSATVENIRAECLQRNHHVIAIVNMAPGNGATTVTMCLAREAARQGQRVALVDLNTMHPNLADNLGIDCEQGIESLQLADVDVEDICVAALEDGVTLVPLLRSIDVEYSASPTIRALLDRIAATHDLVLIDAAKTVVDRLATASPEFGFAVISITKANTTNEISDETSDDHARSDSEASRDLGTIKNFAA